MQSVGSLNDSTATSHSEDFSFSPNSVKMATIKVDPIVVSLPPPTATLTQPLLPEAAAASSGSSDYGTHTGHMSLGDDLSLPLVSPVGSPFATNDLHHLQVIPSSPGRDHEVTDLYSSISQSRTHSRHHSRRSSHVRSPSLWGYGRGHKRDWGLISLSFRSGALMLLFFWVLWDCIVDTKLRPNANNYWIDSVLPLYRASGFLLMSYWMWGINVWVWRTYHINYMFLFELHPRTSDTHRQIFSHCITLTLIFLTNFLFYFKMERGDFPDWWPDGILPSLMFVLLVVIMCPWPGCGTPVKQWPAAFLSVIAAPFFPVKFIHVFIGDVLTSLVKPLIDVLYSVCFITTGLFLVDDLSETNSRTCLDSNVLNKVLNPIISALPLWLRLLQCLRRYFDTRERFPHMVNAGKYATAQSVVIVGIFHANISHGSSGEIFFWILSLTASTLYSYTWDVFMDWDLGKKDHSRLRSDLLYRNKAFYYVAIVLDLFFRFIWTLTFIPASVSSTIGDWYVHSLTPVIAGCEIIRRGVWAIIRVENEHLAQIVTYQRHHHQEQQSATLPRTESFLEDEEAEQEEEEQTKVTKGWVLLLEIGILVLIVVAVALASYFTH